MDRPLPRWQKLSGWGMVALALGWITFRLFSRLSSEPYIDFTAFYQAGEAARTGGDPYIPCFGMYIYPPMLAAWLSPLSLLPQSVAAWVWYALGMSVTLLSLGLTWRGLRERLEFPTESGWFGGVLGLVLLFGLTQTRWEFEHGQCDWLLLACFCLAFAALDRAPWVVGLALGFAINIKYLPVALVVYLATRQRWRAVAWTVAGTLFWAAIPAVVYGWSRNGLLLARGVSGLGKLVGIQSVGQPGMVFDITYDRSVSLVSAFARLAELNGLGLRFALLATGAVAAVVFAIGWIVYRRFGLSLWAGRGGAAERLPVNRGIVAIEWMVMLALMLAFSPQTMFRHYFLMLPLLMLAAGLAVAGATPHCRRLAWTALIVSCLGAVGGDVVGLVAPRTWWNLASGASVAALGLAYLTLVAGIEHIQARERRVMTAGWERSVAA